MHHGDGMVRLYRLKDGYKGRGKYGGQTATMPIFTPMTAMLLHSQGTSVAEANLRSAMAGGWRIQYKNIEAEGGETSTQTTYSGLAADQIHTSYHDIGFELKKV